MTHKIGMISELVLKKKKTHGEQYVCVSVPSSWTNGVKKVEYLPGTEPCVLLRHTGDIVEVSASMPKAS